MSGQNWVPTAQILGLIAGHLVQSIDDYFKFSYRNEVAIAKVYYLITRCKTKRTIAAVSCVTVVNARLLQQQRVVKQLTCTCSCQTDLDSVAF